jgi:hypothetical protein
VIQPLVRAADLQIIAASPDAHHDIVAEAAESSDGGVVLSRPSSGGLEIVRQALVAASK